MIGLLQRVGEASVSVEGNVVGKIGRGLLVLVGVEKHDTHASTHRLLERILSYRVFPDAEGKMNLSLADIGGTGLGLSIARNIIERHDGQLQLANRPGGGLEAQVVLPLAG